MASDRGPDFKGSEMIDADFQYETGTVEAVEPCAGGWYITHGGWQFYVKAEHGIEPRVGDEVRFYGCGIGFPVRGLTINGRVVFYRTEADEAERHRREIARREQKQRDEFERVGRAKLDADYAALPAEFKRRLDGLRRRNADFRWRHESYEMFVCREAVLIAQTLRTADAVRGYGEAAYDEQRRLVPDLSDQHSGNTHGSAVRLAWLWLSRPDLVEYEHGALCPLVGCRDYGCAALDADRPEGGDGE